MPIEFIQRPIKCHRTHTAITSTEQKTIPGETLAPESPTAPTRSSYLHREYLREAPATSLEHPTRQDMLQHDPSRHTPDNRWHDGRTRRLKSYEYRLEYFPLEVPSKQLHGSADSHQPDPALWGERTLYAAWKCSIFEYVRTGRMHCHK